ncbi:hypothetical protein K431DRAFT_129695 [Polychaeton citri CBS 116435]|uniref:Uncharacterized protein n=1 Tax=Polychaeton citri CBS 116435 TaxID=1314669 RepID=A0A9P4UK01_9PEZI|nr:hypothetical protein K431DRAFT_129695 [Polychaeton citri CBS 116435]
MRHATKRLTCVFFHSLSAFQEYCHVSRPLLTLFWLWLLLRRPIVRFKPAMGNKSRVSFCLYRGEAPHYSTAAPKRRRQRPRGTKSNGAHRVPREKPY